MRLYKLFAFLLLFHAAAAQDSGHKDSNAADGNSLLWRISGRGLTRPSFLFGTFHLMCKEDIHFSDSLKQALKYADKVYFEMDLDDPTNTMSALLAMNMKANNTLRSLYSKKEYNRLSVFFKDSVGMPLEMMETMKPAFVEVMLYPKLMPCTHRSGIEEELMKLAKADKKPILGFETMAFQAAVFDSIPYAEQAKELLRTVDSFHAYKQYFEQMLNAYKTQNLYQIAAMFSKTEFGVQDNQDILLDNRNKTWVSKLKKIFPDNSLFIAVGAGHLVGEKGLIALLRKEGYTLTPLVNR